MLETIKCRWRPTGKKYENAIECDTDCKQVDEYTPYVTVRCTCGKLIELVRD